MGDARSSDEIIRIIEAAKLHPDDLDPRVQEIHFHKDFCGNELRLLELDPSVEKFVTNGSSLVLRGEETEAAVICTSDATYELKDTEISNSLLILEELSFLQEASKAKRSKSSPGTQESSENDVRPVQERVIMGKQILSIAHSYLEMRRVKPHLGRIIHLLDPTRFRGVDSELEVNESQLISVDILIDKIPASVNEIEEYLNSIKYVELDGNLRLIDTDYLFRVLNFVLAIVDENSWANDKIVKNIIMSQLSSIEPELILEKVFEWFFLPSDTSPPENEEQNDLVIDEELYTMNQNSICQLFGEIILKRGSRFNFREFLKSWQESVPAGLKVNAKQLKEFAVVDESSSPPTIQYFPEFNLPSNIQDRLKILFETKAKWRHDDILPFVISLATSEQNASIFLTKYCRVASTDGVKVYSAKYVK